MIFIRERDFFDFLEFTEYLNTSGTGVNAKLGAIVSLTKFLRWGLAFQTPTSYRFEDNFATTLAYQFTADNDQNYFDEESPNGNFDYRFSTPLKLSTSLGYIIQKSGFLSAEAEWIPYHKSRFRFDQDIAYQDELNIEIATNLRSVFNLKVGGEFAYNWFRVRGGIQFNTNPFVGETQIDQSYSAGLGFRLNRVFIDLGYRYFNRTDEYTPYALPSSLGFDVGVDQDINSQYLSMTLGIKF